MAFVLLSRSRGKTQGSVRPAPQRKSARGQHSADSRPGFAKPVFQRHTTALPTAPVIQTKLKIGEPNDEFEQEADRMADRVMRMAATNFELPLSQLNMTPLAQRRIAGNGRGPRGVVAPIFQRQKALAGQQLSSDVQQIAGEERQEGSPCPSWFSDPESISKRAAETYVQNEMTPPSQATVERIDCEPPVPSGNYACTVHFSDGLVIRVIVRKQDIVVGVPPLTTLTPPATPLCFYDYACPEGNLVLTKRECKSAKGSAATGSSAPAKIQRKCAACTSNKGLCPMCIEEERIRRQPLASIITPMMQRQSKAPAAFKKEEREMPQVKETPDQAPVVSPALEDQLSEIKNSGQPLPESVRAFFEPRFGVDFSGVRVHADGQAAQLAQAVNAWAFTMGRDVVFGAGQYAPEAGAGKRLLAHELTHVVQHKESDQIGVSVIRRQERNPLRNLGTFTTVDYRTEALVDAALIQSQLWPYIGHKVTQGTRVKGGVTYLPQREFKEAYIAHARRRGEAIERVENVRGYYDPKRDRIVLAIPATLETLLHEAIHKFADPSFRRVFAAGLDEGVTQYFTNHVLAEYGLSPGKAYAQEVVAANALAPAVGFEDLALGYFLGPAINVLRALQSNVPGFETNRFLTAIRQERVDWRQVANMIRVPREIRMYEIRHEFRGARG